MKQTMKWKMILLAAIFLLTLIQGGVYGNHSWAQAAGQYGASRACDGHSLGTVNGCPACVSGDSMHICENNFPDVVFRNKLIEKYGGEHVALETVSSEEALSVSGYDFDSQTFGDEISCLNGIEFFPSLKVLDCGYNSLTELDVRRNTALKSLDVWGNNLTELDVSQNTELVNLECGFCQLTCLDVSQNTALRYLNCYGNQLTELDMSQNTELANLYCAENQLTELNVSNSRALIRLECYENQLTTLDVSGLIELEYLDCNGNNIETLNASGCTSLAEMWFVPDYLTSVDISGTAFGWFRCLGAKQLKSLNASGCTELYYLDCQDCELTNLDVSGCTALDYLDCSLNQLASLDLSGNQSLTDCYISPQTIQVAPDSATQLDMSRLVGRENLDRIVNVWNGSYDAATGILTLEEGVDHYIYEYDTQNAAAGKMEVEIELIEAAVIDSVALTMGDRIDANIYLKVPAEATKAVITYSYPGWKVPDVQEYVFSNMNPDSQGRYQLDVINIPAKELIETMTLRVYDRNGNLIPLSMQTAVGRMTDANTYVFGSADYANVVVAKGNEQQRKQAKALLNYGSMVQWVLSHKTETLAASAAILTEMATEMNAIQVNHNYDGVLPTGTVKENLGYQSLSLNLEGEIQILLSFSKKVTATMNGKALQVQRNDSSSSYEVVIPHIRAKNMDIIHEVEVSYGTTSFTFQVCALTYANRILATANAPQPYTNLAKAMYIYQQETLNLFGR